MWGLLLELDPDAVEEMDRSEGTRTNIPHYTKETIRVITDDGVEHECKTYVANFHPNRFDEDGVPTILSDCLESGTYTIKEPIKERKRFDHEYKQSYEHKKDDEDASKLLSIKNFPPNFR